MKRDLENEFQTIGDDAVVSAERVEASFDDFVEGLEIIVATLRDRLEMARDEQRSRSEE